jgi:hypothetical protein
MTDLTALTLIGRLALGSAAHHRRRVPSSTRASASAVTTCMPAVSAPSSTPGQRRCAQPIGLLYVTVSVRWLPLVPAPYGTWVARPVGTMWLAPVGEGSPLAGRVWLTAGDDGLVGKPRSGAAASGRPGSRSVEPPAQLPSVGSRNDDSWFR